MGYRKIKNLYQDQTVLLFKECYALEKIHGCLVNNTPIRMADGSKRAISKLVNSNAIGEYVLGYRDGQIVKSKILNVFNNGSSAMWLNIKGTRNAVGRGGNLFSIRCTPNHKFWTGESYIPAFKLATNDSIYILRSDLEITPLQKQVLLGKLFGDATLNKKDNLSTITFSHKVEHKKYLEWSAKGLGNIAYIENKEYISGYGTPMKRGHTRSLYFIQDYLKSFISNGKKVIPDWVIDEVGPIALAFWYMDDGSLSHDDGQQDRALFAVCDFDERSCKTLQKCLGKFNVESVFYIDTEGYPRLRLNANDADKFFLIVAPYIPKCMQYKLPKRYRGHRGWLPQDVDNCYKEHLVEQKITSIEEIDYSSSRYDIETETHNFFANDILVHNSSTHIQWKSVNTPSLFEMTTFSGGVKHATFESMLDERFDLEKLHNMFLEYTQDWPDIKTLTVYGEAYGGKCQRMNKVYGPLNFIAFEVNVDGSCLDVPTSERVCEKLGLPFVYYERGPATVEWLDAQRNLPSQQARRNGMGDNKIGEGIVVRPLVEMCTNDGRPVMAKHKREDFRETRKPRRVGKDLEVLSKAEDIALEWVTQMRLQHVIDALKITTPSPELTGDVIKAMVEDIKAESEGEIEWSNAATKAIGRRTAQMYRGIMKESL